MSSPLQNHRLGWFLLILVSFAASRLEAQEEEEATQQLNRLRILQNLMLQNVEQVSADVKEWSIFSVNSGISYTSNAALTENGGASDFYLTNASGARWQPDLGNGFGFSSGIVITDFRYLRNTSLSISYLDWDAGLTWNGKVAGFDTQAYVSHTLEWTQQQAFQIQTFASILALGTVFSRETFRNQTITFAQDLSATPYSTPWSINYASATLSGSYAWTPIPSLTLAASALAYGTMYFSGQRDFTTSCGVTLAWEITPWLSASAFANETWNFSPTGGSNYTVLDTGINLLAFFKF